MARPGLARRLAIIAGYVVVFWLAVPAALYSAGRLLDAALGLPGLQSDWGWPLAAAGLGLVAWSAAALSSRGRGLPISALPPQDLVATGPYSLARHPVYLGFHAALVGTALGIGSLGLLVVAGPVFLACWLAYARWEEQGLRRRFGQSYAIYQTQVGLFPSVPLYRVAQLLMRARVIPLEISGLENLPRGPFVLVGNHSCYLDPFLIACVTWRKVHFLTTAQAFRTPFMRWVLGRIGTVAMRRYRSDVLALRTARWLLDQGAIVGYLPEGERSPLGVYEGALPGTGALLARRGVPVVPVGIIGAYDVGPRWSGVLRRRPVRLRVGPPIVWGGDDRNRTLDAAIAALLAGAEPRVRLAGLPLSKLHRVLWSCPRCGDEPGWRAAELRCVACGGNYAPTSDGLLADESGATRTLASLALPSFEGAAAGVPIRCRAHGFHEADIFGPIRALEPLGEELLEILPDAIAFGTLRVPMASIRTATTERADTLQIATSTEMWQFRPARESVFRLQAAVRQLCAAGRTSPVVPPSRAGKGDRGG
jgi:1-acyl-sn-glycerol-3-phosphate acyltransferase